MARLAATDVTVAILDRGIVGKKRRTYGTITFDSTALTYTIATGIPLPAYGVFGFLKKIDIMFFTQDVGAGATELVYKYDPTNGSIRVYRAAGFSPAGTIAAPVFTGTTYTQTDAVATAPAGTISAPTFTGTAVAASNLAEFTDNTALGGAVTLYFDAIGV